jgi:murein DD-endopeptidase MepM/ murein hydrolase activator NlpD
MSKKNKKEKDKKKRKKQPRTEPRVNNQEVSVESSETVLAMQMPVAAAAVPSPTISLILPVNGPITQYFGENPPFYAKWGYQGHNGVDFGVMNGTPVVASADGKVDRVAFENGGYGNYVRISHANGYYLTYYAHLQEAAISVGKQVKAGEVIGYSNNTGASTGPHLHWGVSIPSKPNPGFKTYYDPLQYVGGINGSPSTGGEITIPVQGGITSFDLSGLKLKVSVEQLNVRSGPSVSFPIVTTVKQGSILEPEALGSNAEVWIKVKEGWCAALYNGMIHVEKGE